MLARAAARAGRRSAAPRGFNPAASSPAVASARRLGPRPSSRVSFSSAHPVSAAIPLSVGVAAGGFAGTISALTGVGGGVILIPTLAKFTTLPQQVVNGTSIGSVCVASTVGAFNYLDKGSCNLPIAMAVTVPAIICTRYGVRAAHRLSSNRLSLVVGAAMLASSPLIFLKNSAYFPKFSDQAPRLDLQFYTAPSRHATYVAEAEANVPAFVRDNVKYLVAGALAGFISGMCGLGGGILMTSYLTAASDMPQETIIGTSMLGIVPTAMASTYHNLRVRSVHLPSAARIGGTLAVGVYVTSKYVTQDVPEDVLRAILGTTLSAAAIVMMRRSI